MKLERIVDPVGFPITTDLVYAALNLSPGTDIDLINNYIASATDDLERDTDRALIYQTYRMTLDRFPNTCYSGNTPQEQTIYLPKGKTLSITKFEYLDKDENVQALVDGTDYTLTNTCNEARILPIGSFPATFEDRNETVVIEYVVGLGADESEMPSWVKTALLLKIQGLYDSCNDTAMAYHSAIASRQIFFQYDINDRYNVLYY